jgi:hypothetical protein
MPHIFFIHSSINGHLGDYLTWLLWIVLQWTKECRYLWHSNFISSGYMLSSEISVSHGSSILILGVTFHTVSHNGCTNLHSYQKCRRVPLSLSFFISIAGILCLFGNTHSNRGEVISHCGFVYLFLLFFSFFFFGSTGTPPLEPRFLPYLFFFEKYIFRSFPIFQLCYFAELLRVPSMLWMLTPLSDVQL